MSLVKIADHWERGSAMSDWFIDFYSLWLLAVMARSTCNFFSQFVCTFAKKSSKLCTRHEQNYNRLNDLIDCCALTIRCSSLRTVKLCVLPTERSSNPHRCQKMARIGSVSVLACLWYTVRLPFMRESPKNEKCRLACWKGQARSAHYLNWNRS